MKILLAEDEHRIATMIKKGLEQERFRVDVVYAGDQALDLIMLTAKDQNQDIVAGLNAGADDYLTKPFTFAELIARLHALSRRPHQTVANQLEVGNLRLDPQRFTVTRAEQPVQLSSKEFSLLEYLMRRPNQIITKNQIIEHIWDYDASVLPNTVEVYIRNLRTKIDRPFTQDTPLLHTIRGFGYKIGHAGHV